MTRKNLPPSTITAADIQAALEPRAEGMVWRYYIGSVPEHHGLSDMRALEVLENNGWDRADARATLEGARRQHEARSRAAAGELPIYCPGCSKRDGTHMADCETLRGTSEYQGL